MKNYQELGAILQEARRKQNLQISDLSKKTGLPEKYLAALEAGSFDRLPGKAYARIYFLNYARALGLDTETLMLDWPHPVRAEEPALLVPPHNPWPKRILTTAIIVILVGMAYSLWRFRAEIGGPPGGVYPDTSSALVEPPPAPVYRDSGDTIGDTLDTAGETIDTTPADTNTPAESTAEPEAETPPPADEIHRLVIRASSQSWVVVEADGDTVLAQVVSGGRSLNAEAKSSFSLTAARPEVISVFLDGKAVELPKDHTRPLVRYRIVPKPSEGTR